MEARPSYCTYTTPGKAHLQRPIAKGIASLFYHGWSIAHTPINLNPHTHEAPPAALRLTCVWKGGHSSDGGAQPQLQQQPPREPPQRGVLASPPACVAPSSD
eukprot:5047184-Pyramimonas_sp.AAC.1